MSGPVAVVFLQGIGGAAKLWDPQVDSFAMAGYLPVALDLPGYSHHVAALRGSSGWADANTNTYFEVGGLSGGTYQIFPGYTIGEGRRSFPVRGYSAASARGIRAASASVEYRAPLSISQRTVGTLPTFFQRSALTFFGDYGVAWCPSTLASRQVCIDPAEEKKTDLA